MVSMRSTVSSRLPIVVSAGQVSVALLSLRVIGPGRVTLPLFFFKDPATTEIYTLSLHDALPIFTKLIAGERVPLTVTESKLELTVAVPSLAWAWAVLVTEPASKTARAPV